MAGVKRIIVTCAAVGEIVLGGPRLARTPIGRKSVASYASPMNNKMGSAAVPPSALRHSNLGPSQMNSPALPRQGALPSAAKSPHHRLPEGPDAVGMPQKDVIHSASLNGMDSHSFIRFQVQCRQLHGLASLLWRNTNLLC